jgi:hypothetical protein
MWISAFPGDIARQALLPLGMVRGLLLEEKIGFGFGNVVDRGNCIKIQPITAARPPPSTGRHR